MKYKIVYSKDVLKQFKKLDKHIAKGILDYLEEIENLDNPFSRGKGLVEDKKGIWRYRYKDWRILCEVKDQELIIHVVKVGHRKDIYK